MRILLILSLLTLCGCATNYELGWTAYKAEDHDRAVQLLQPYAVEGDSYAQQYLGWVTHIGAGSSTVNYDWAMQWYLAAARQGRAYAANKIGVMHQHGDGVEIDRGKAVAWYTLAARRGSQEARAKLTELGKPVPVADLVPTQQQKSNQRQDDTSDALSKMFMLWGLGAATTPMVYPTGGNRTINCTSQTFGSTTETRCK